MRILCVLLSDATVGDRAGSRHSSHSKSQSYDSVNMPSGNESLLKAIKVGCLGLVHLRDNCLRLMLQICPQLMPR